MVHAHVVLMISARVGLHFTLMFPAHVLDRYYLATTAFITVAWQLAGFFLA